MCQVTASYSHHVKEIFSAVITEYTDWASVARHPVTTRQPQHPHHGYTGKLYAVTVMVT